MIVSGSPSQPPLKGRSLARRVGALSTNVTNGTKESLFRGVRVIRGRKCYYIIVCLRILGFEDF